ncbi:hypothetical protein DL93DRAFT_2090360 [Clavulina sp. PMI_390]|nr:hypothetical protein DL93DRAFT_2090360 [Clavulina sp. PMI_390]
MQRKLDSLSTTTTVMVEPAEYAMDAESTSTRPEALLLQGQPIGKLSTEKIFEYCAYYSSTEIKQLEWVDDENCVLVYEDSTLATAAYNALRKSKDSDSIDELELTPCHPIPMSLWSAADRLATSLGLASATSTATKTDSTESSANSAAPGLKGQLSIRRALKTDIKVRGARNKSKYYEAHGGPPLSGRISQKRGRTDDEDEDQGDDGRGRRRRTDNGGYSEHERERARAELDAQLDRFASGGEPEQADGGPSLVNRLGAAPPNRDGERHQRRIAPLPTRRGARRGDDRHKGRREPRVTVDKDTLDAELDAFLKGE